MAWARPRAVGVAFIYAKTYNYIKVSVWDSRASGRRRRVSGAGAAAQGPMGQGLGGGEITGDFQFHLPARGGRRMGFQNLDTRK